MPTTTTTKSPHQKQKEIGTSVAIQWLRLCTSSSGGTGLIPGWELKMPHAACHAHPPKKTDKYVMYDVLVNSMEVLLLQHFSVPDNYVVDIII